MSRRAGYAVALLATTPLASACSDTGDPRDQWTVSITTDAPVPSLVDRALVEVVGDDGQLACGDCRRQLGLPTDPKSWPISFGVAATSAGRPLHVRVRLYRAQRSGADGFPLPATTIDRIAKLPPASGDTAVGLVLRGECLGIPANATTRDGCVGPDRSLLPEATLPVGPPDRSVVPGSWVRSARRPCVGNVPEGMTCVPGGFFVLGDAMAQTAIRTPPRPERFVTVPPFALDQQEMTVGAFRKLVAQRRVTAATVRADDPLALAGQCTYLGTTDGSNDGLPINCVTHKVAADACQALGRRLPTEAEWEWAAGNLELETFYPWGDQGDPCDLADVGLGRFTLEGSYLESALCRARPGRDTETAGLPRTANPGDTTSLGIRGLAGGVSEWTQDYLQAYDAPCWSPTEPFLTNPRCAAAERASGAANFVLRGSSWSDTPGFTSTLQRQGAGPTSSYPSIGFRCAVSLE
jgi:formylglycine-generating enzyme